MPSHAASTGLEFKGVPFGTAKAEVRKRMPGLSCSRVETQCAIFNTTYAAEPAEAIALHFVDDRLARAVILFKPESFERITSALHERYGPPATTKTGTVSTAMGAKAAQISQWWKLTDGRSILIERYGTKITNGNLVLSAPSALANDARQDAKQARRAKGDI